MLDTEWSPCPLGCRAGDDPLVTAANWRAGPAGRFTVVRCRACRLARTDPRPTAAAMGAFYPDCYDAFVDRSDDRLASLRRVGRRVLRTGAHALPPLAPGAVLDVGCANGAELVEMQRQGWSVAGIEPSASACAVAAARGVPVIHGTVESCDELPAGLDLVTAWNALEHLHHPVEALRRLRSSLRPGGWLVVSVPNLDSLGFRAFGARWYGLSVPHHLYHFTPTTLARVLAAGGFRLDRLVYQRWAIDLVASASIVRLEREQRRTGRRPGTASTGPLWAQAVLYPLSLGLAAAGRSGSMTAWARRA
ncbi:MAG: class I SAM-dependent methyltransferase [Acidimicrobiales bacterium]|nr:class I SAM-dependent methyltransferase [Acidimicrobiales bacterium]